jgi:hypothetical protein
MENPHSKKVLEKNFKKDIDFVCNAAVAGVKDAVNDPIKKQNGLNRRFNLNRRFKSKI